ncbi:MAG: trehalase family glycosidase [Prevotella sp.]|jgi:alpha,alpha-trehalase
MKPIYIILSTALCITLSLNAREVKVDIDPTNYELPSVMYGRFFYDVMGRDSLFGENKLFIESKTFVDMVPKRRLENILSDYHATHPKDISTFILNNFFIPASIEKSLTGERKDIDSYIKELWSFLTCQPDTDKEGTRINMKYPYFVPGGRFREMYYWDSYFSMLGMLCDGEYPLVMNMLENFADVINRIGFIPNGMRSYYIGRSQPPYFTHMIEDASNHFGAQLYVRFLPEMMKEYQFWMDGQTILSPAEPAYKRVVLMPDGEILNRYYDNYAQPREEAYRNDIATGKKLLSLYPQLDINELYRNLRAGAESGLDFSSRWFADGQHLYTIRTTDIVPVDLNCLLYHMETSIAKAYKLKGDKQECKRYMSLARNRAHAIQKYFWSEAQRFYVDYVLPEHQQSPYLSLVGLYPLYCKIAPKAAAKKVETTIKTTFLKAGGCVTSPYNTGEQWDAPNGWAPLEWVTYKGLRNYHLDNTANLLKTRWLSTVRKVYNEKGILKEKYNVVSQSDTGGGEYSNQTGFGWTNGVFRAMESDN